MPIDTPVARVDPVLRPPVPEIEAAVKVFLDHWNDGHARVDSAAVPELVALILNHARLGDAHREVEARRKAADEANRRAADDARKLADDRRNAAGTVGATGSDWDRRSTGYGGQTGSTGAGWTGPASGTTGAGNDPFRMSDHSTGVRTSDPHPAPTSPSSFEG